MAKQKKNANYQTEKNIAEKAQREAEKQRAKRDKKIKTAVIASAIAVGVIAIFVGILFACGAFKYTPEATYHASFSVEGHDAIHIELYGNDAPNTVKHFIDLCEDGYFDGLSVNALINDLLYCGSSHSDGGSKSIKGEFADNGFDNKIRMEEGVVAMARGEGYDSAYGRFFILTEKDRSLEGKYAAFGRVTNMEVIYDIIESLTVKDDGSIENPPKITEVSMHEAHHH